MYRPLEPFVLKPSPDRKVTIENLHNAEKDCYFLRVSFEGEGRHWTRDYYEGDEEPIEFQAAANAAFGEAVHEQPEKTKPEFSGEF